MYSVVVVVELQGGDIGSSFLSASHKDRRNPLIACDEIEIVGEVVVNVVHRSASFTWSVRYTLDSNVLWDLVE
jgi:hypothetical protein